MSNFGGFAAFGIVEAEALLYKNSNPTVMGALVSAAVAILVMTIVTVPVLTQISFQHATVQSTAHIGSELASGEIPERKDFELSKGEVSKIEITEKRTVLQRLSRNRLRNKELLITSTKDSVKPIRIQLGFDETVLKSAKSLMMRFCPERFVQ